MTNIQKIRFETKYRLKFVNGFYMISGFNHNKTLRVSEQEIELVLDSDLEQFTEKQWYEYIEDFNKE